jgi:error-prone DNA polymerase
MQFLRERLQSGGVASSRDLEEKYEDGDRVVVAGLVVARQHPETAKGTVFLLLEDEFGYMNAIVPRYLYERYREVVKFSTFMVIEGGVQREERVINIVGKRFRELETEKLAARSHDFH